MSRSRLYRHRRKIADALGRGESVSAIARRYGVDHTTAAEFVARWLPELATDGARRKVESHRVRAAERYRVYTAYRDRQAVAS